MRYILTIVFATSAFITARPPEVTTYSVLDDYYGELLLPRDDIQTVGNKIQYPGFVRDTVQSVGAGYLSHNYDNSEVLSEEIQKSFALESATIRSDDFYSWAEKNTRIGSIGVRIGDLSFREHAENHLTYSRFQGQHSGQGSIWFSPRQHTLLDGVSADIQRYHSVDTNLDKRPFYAEEVKSNNDLNSLNFRTTLNMEHGKHLFLGYKWIDAADGTRNNYRYYDTTGRITNVNSNQRKTDRRSNLMTAGVLSAGGKQLNAVLSFESSDVHYPFSSDSYSGVCGLYVEGSMSKKVDYLKHSLRLGVYGLAGSTATVTGVEHVDFNHARYNVSHDNMEVLGIVRIPCILDVNLFGSAMYGLINFTPELYGRYYRRTDNEGIATGHSLQITARQLSIGVRGRIGDKLEFLLVPSLQSNIFITGLEIRYLL